MYYIEKDEKEVVKYRIHLYNDHLNEIRDRLIKDYSSIINVYNHFCFSNINKLETDKIKNYSNNSIKIDFSYYVHPELVILIDMLLTGNVTSIEKIINYKQKQISLDNFYNEVFLKNICDNLTNELNIDFTINDLLAYLKNKNNIYINNEDYEFLKEEIMKCISYERISAVNINDFYKMIDFLNISSKDIFNNNINDYKKRIKEKK